MSEHFDVLVIGAGPSGNAAAYTAAKAGLKVLQIERGESPGSKNVQGAILYSDALEKIIPDFREDVTRAKTVTVRAQDAGGKFFEHTGEDLLARAFLHETDHLNGKLYISHISGLKRDLIKRKIKKMVKAGEW